MWLTGDANFHLAGAASRDSEKSCVVGLSLPLGMPVGSVPWRVSRFEMPYILTQAETWSETFG